MFRTALLIVSVLASLFFLSALAINFYDYTFRTDIPFRNGDFRDLMLLNTIGLATALAISAFLLLTSRRRRQRPQEGSDRAH